MINVTYPQKLNSMARFAHQLREQLANEIDDQFAWEAEPKAFWSNEDGEIIRSLEAPHRPGFVQIMAPTSIFDLVPDIEAEHTDAAGELWFFHADAQRLADRLLSE